MLPEGDSGGDGRVPSLVGETLDGRYSVEARLGEGGMATVFLAEDLRLARKVVVKVPHPSLLLEQGFRKRFEQEISSLIALEHPHVVRIHDSGEFRGLPYAVMQHLAGGSLLDRMKEAGGRLPVSTVADWLPKAAAALDFIHSRGMVHRDVKPENVLFDRAGNPFLADFGIARTVSGIETRITRTGFLAGSPAYMAPEVVRGEAAGPPYDQYALALVAYESLAGAGPHEGTTPLSLLTKRATEPPRDLGPLAPEVPPGAAAAIMRALSQDPKARFPCCAELVRAFERGLAGESPPPPPPPAPATAAAPGPPAGNAPPPASRAPRRVLLLTGSAAAVACAAAIAAVLGGGKEGDSPPPRSPSVPALADGSANRPHEAAAGEPPTEEAAEPGPPVPQEAPSASLAEPGEGASVVEGLVAVRGSVKGVGSGDRLLVNGVAARVEGGEFSAAVTLPPGDQEVEVLAGGVPLAARTVTVRPAARPGPADGVPEWARVSAQQVAEAHRLGVPVAFENRLGMRFVLVPAGRFLMGSPEDEPGRQAEYESLHAVTLTRPFYLQATEVTNAQFRAWRKGHQSGRMGGISMNEDEQPATFVDHGEASGFCAWLQAGAEGRTYRLPTEAEWEYACRAGTRTRYWWGDSEADAGTRENVADRAARSEQPSWTVFDSDDGFAATSPVGSLAPNPWGLWDTGGNAMEWCADGFQPYGGDGVVDPVGPAGSSMATLRIASYRSTPADGRVAFRGYVPAETKQEGFGFRVACDLPAIPEPAAATAVVVEPAEGATVLEGAVKVRGTLAGAASGTGVRVNGVVAEVRAGSFEATITLPPGPQEMEVVAAGVPAALRKVTVEAAPRPSPGEGVPGWAQVSAQQIAEARRLGVPAAFENALGMRFVLVPAGRFRMGSPETEARRNADEVLHAVTLTRPFYLQATEVTLEEFRAWKPGFSGGSLPNPDIRLDGPGHPATGVSPTVAEEFCRWLAAGDSPRRYRLPTEAEWEYAARSGTRTAFWWGDDETVAGRYANFADRTAKAVFPDWTISDTEDGFVGTSPVAHFPPSPWGLWDMLGNVVEPCSDGMRTILGDPEVDPAGPADSSARNARGGSFSQGGQGCRSAVRGSIPPDFVVAFVGFRVACDLPERK